ncbi:hypothetical protein BKA61DRAFT_580124 [Leptodontidium sp. MPI-SDFR-AT-0119]|nr:hypothetical protein BKA61DRAFT_580124 [Leptodontidium sp. MPI-SDFR-AT-0119]
MRDELWRRKRLNGYAIATGFEYTWQDVDALVDIAELAIDQHIRRTFDIDVCLELDPNWVGKDRSWVEYEAECQVWTAVGPNNLNYPKKEPKLPFWWPYLREEVKAELQTVMNRTGSAWGYDEDGRVSYVTFVHPLLHVNRGGRGGVVSVMSGQSIPGGWGSPINSPPGWNTTRPAPSTATTQSSISPTLNDDQPLHGAIFSKDIISFILLPLGKQEYIAPVETKFRCKIRGTQAEIP